MFTKYRGHPSKDSWIKIININGKEVFPYYLLNKHQVYLSFIRIQFPPSKMASFWGFQKHPCWSYRFIHPSIEGSLGILRVPQKIVPKIHSWGLLETSRKIPGFTSFKTYIISDVHIYLCQSFISMFAAPNSQNARWKPPDKLENNNTSHTFDAAGSRGSEPNFEMVLAFVVLPYPFGPQKPWKFSVITIGN